MSADGHDSSLPHDDQEDLREEDKDLDEEMIVKEVSEDQESSTDPAMVYAEQMSKEQVSMTIEEEEDIEQAVSDNVSQRVLASSSPPSTVRGEGDPLAHSTPAKGMPQSLLSSSSSSRSSSRPESPLPKSSLPEGDEQVGLQAFLNPHVTSQLMAPHHTPSTASMEVNVASCAQFEVEEESSTSADDKVMEDASSEHEAGGIQMVIGSSDPLAEVPDDEEDEAAEVRRAAEAIDVSANEEDLEADGNDGAVTAPGVDESSSSSLSSRNSPTPDSQHQATADVAQSSDSGIKNSFCIVKVGVKQ